jgi:signal transduction histidine kinase
LKLLGLPAAARAFCAELERRHGIAITVYERADLRQLPETHGLTLYRVMQESLQNAIKHSGASDASVTFACDEEGASVTIADNGSGFDPEIAAGGTGLAGMRERLRLVGGTLDVVSAHEEGTTIRARVPELEVVT